MKNLKLLSLALLMWVLVLTWCENINNNENLSCTDGDTCSIEKNIESSSIEIEETPSVIINEEEWDLNWNWEWVREEDFVFENNEQINEEPTDQPMMRKMVVDENATPEEIENDIAETCGNLGWNRTDWMCTLEDWTEIAF